MVGTNSTLSHPLNIERDSYSPSIKLSVALKKKKKSYNGFKIKNEKEKKEIPSSSPSLRWSFGTFGKRKMKNHQ